MIEGRERGRVSRLVMVPQSRCLERVITKSNCLLSTAERKTTGSGIEKGRKEGGMVESWRETETQEEKKYGKEGNERRRGRRQTLESWRRPANAPDCAVYCMGKMVGSARPPTCTPTTTTTSPNFSLLQPQLQPHSTVFPKRARLYSWPY